MLDEVQELAIHPDGASVAAALRASMQRNYARLRDEQLIYQAARGTYRVNNSVLAEQLRESTPQMADPKAVALPPLALGAAVRPIAAAPGHSYVGHVLEVTITWSCKIPGDLHPP